VIFIRRCNRENLQNTQESVICHGNSYIGDRLETLFSVPLTRVDRALKSSGLELTDNDVLIKKRSSQDVIEPGVIETLKTTMSMFKPYWWSASDAVEC
jgi:hypothetical protein